MANSETRLPDSHGRFGSFGGQFVPETLMVALQELVDEYEAAKVDPAFQTQYEKLMRGYVGRPTPLYFAQRLTELHIELRDGLLVDRVPHALPALPFRQRRVGDDQPRVVQLLKRIEHGRRRDVEGGGDLGARLVRMHPEVSDDAGSEPVAERFDGILRAIAVCGAGVFGHAPFSRTSSYRVQRTV